MKTPEIRWRNIALAACVVALVLLAPAVLVAIAPMAVLAALLPVGASLALATPLIAVGALITVFIAAVRIFSGSARRSRR